MRNGQSVASEKQEEVQSAVQKTDESSESVSIEEQEADLAYDTMEACFYLPIHTSHLK